MSAYRKGYRAEQEATEFMSKNYGCVCIRAGGSHGLADLICGNGAFVYAIQVKYGNKKPTIDWKAFRMFASNFKAIPILLWRRKYKGWIVAYNEDDLKSVVPQKKRNEKSSKTEKTPTCLKTCQCQTEKFKYLHNHVNNAETRKE